MVDRFYGFRFELSGQSFDQSTMDLILQAADSMSCFGWVQLSTHGSLVGEARCSKARGPVFQDKLVRISDKVSSSNVLVSHLF